MAAIIIERLDVKDIRFPTSIEHHGSDAMHGDPDYSCAYVTLETSIALCGYGLSFTLGRGTEIVVTAIRALEHLVIGQDIRKIFEDFSGFWRKLTSDSQLRWVGPEKGAVHLATGAVVNAMWDLWARLHGKPLWQLLSDMEPEMLVSTIDFRYITDLITKEEAIAILRENQDKRKERKIELIKNGYPAYTTQVGWLGYSDSKVKSLCESYLESGFDAFKIKVGLDLEKDKNRCRLVRSVIGEKNHLMVDANQKWEVEEAIKWMKELAPYKPLWIEEPTSPDDILGHEAVAKALAPLGIGVASGEMCSNRVMFKQFLQRGAIRFCQVDICRLAGVNELLAVYLMAHKMSVLVCPHAGGVGLCEMVQHLQMWDYVCLSGSWEGRYIEYVDQQHQHFVHPVTLVNARYQPPQEPGFSSEMKKDVLTNYEYPGGNVWQRLFKLSQL